MLRPVTNPRQRAALQAIAAMEGLTLAELEQATVLAEHITEGGGVDLRAMPEASRRLWARNLMESRRRRAGEESTK